MRGYTAAVNGEQILSLAKEASLRKTNCADETDRLQRQNSARV